MRSTTPRRPSARLALIAALAGAICAYRPLRAVEAAPPDAGETAPEKRRVPISAYAWPAALDPEPKEEDWAGATELEPAVMTSVSTSLPADLRKTVCEQRAIGAWLRIVCTPPATARVGVLWGLAGDEAKVKAKFTLVSDFDKKAPTNTQEALEHKMGTSAAITIPLSPGSALLLRLDGIAWDDEYEWSGVVTTPGLLVDISWAMGEKYPTILYR